MELADNVRDRGWASYWSPDGTRITYAVEQEDFTLSLFVADADGTAIRIADDYSFWSYWLWSPDSTRFASLISTDSTVRLVIEDVATGEQTTRFDVAPDLPEICGRWTTWTTAGIRPNRLPECS